MSKPVDQLEYERFKRELNTRLNAMHDSIAALSTNATNQAAKLAALDTREMRVNQAIGPLVALTPLDVTVNWPQEWPDTVYSVVPILTTGSAVLGAVSCTPKSGSKTTTQCVVTVEASVAVVSAGLEVTGIRAIT